MLNRICLSWLAALMAAAPYARAGESGLNVIVVVNQNSANSLQLGNDYCEWRGVPPQNVLRMTGWTSGSISWTQSNFESYLLNPLLAMVSSNGLAQQAQVVLLSMDIPYRVINGDSENGTTSALFYGFKTNTTPPAGLPDTCSLPDDSTNSYSYSELPFALAEPATAGTNAFLAVMLTDTNLALAQATLERGMAGDSTFPTNTVHLEKTDDTARNVRFVLFDNAIQECRARGDEDVTRTNSDFTGWTNALGLETGLATFSLPADAFVPGAVGDSLTSFGGEIFESTCQTCQTTLLAFLEAGASGSYGTVVEPCNYTYKFPDPMVYFYQDRGFCLAEAYYQSLANPYQGLMGGEPLSAPFARPGSATWNSPAAGSVLSNQAAFNLSFSAAATNLPLAQVDLFMDGGFVQTVTNVPLNAGNDLSVTVAGITASYTVAGGDSLASAAVGLAAAVENEIGVQADAVGDRLVLRSTNVAVLGSRIPVQAGAAIGSAGALTSLATAALPTFLDSTAYGYHVVEAGNNPAVGDWLQMKFIKTNGTQVTVAVTNTQSGASISSLLQSLMNQINATAALQTADGASASDLLDNGGGFFIFIVNAASPGWPAAQIQAVFTGSSDLDPTPAGAYALEDNVSDLQPRAHVYLSSGAAALPVQFILDTTQFADGFHNLTAVAYEGTSVRTQTRMEQTVQFRNTALSATFAALPAATNGNLQFAIAPSATNITRIELFSTGGAVAAAANQAAAVLVAPAATLGVGLHPFYAVVTDASGHEYQTPTEWEQVPALELSVIGPPQALSWPAIAGRQYRILSATNLGGVFQVAGTVLATNTQAQWTISAPAAGAIFYRVSVAP